jgi:glucokinase
MNPIMTISPSYQPHAFHVLGVDIGGTKLATVLATRNGEILHKVRRPTRAELGSEFGVARLISMIQQNLSESGVPTSDIVGIGVACGSPMNAEQGIILGPPNLQSWNPVPIKARLETEFGLYTQLENDANAGALGEWLFGAGKGKKNLVYMTMGTGIGGGLIVDGKLYRGTNGNAGEVGHMRVVLQGGPLCGCGKYGCLEAFCSGPAIARRTRQAVQDALAIPATASSAAALLELAGDVNAINAKHLFDAAKGENALALQVVDETAHYMGIGLANIIQVLNPEVIVLGTIATEQGDFFLERVRQVVRRETWPQMCAAVEIQPSPLGSQVGDYGAISVILQNLV